MLKPSNSHNKSNDNNFSENNCGLCAFQKIFSSQTFEEEEQSSEIMDDKGNYQSDSSSDPRQDSVNQNLVSVNNVAELNNNLSDNDINNSDNNFPIEIHDKKDSKIKISTKCEFKCEYNGCGKVYKSKENLKLHTKNKHENFKPYKCRFCISTFSHRNGKTYHERKFHINYLPYKCTYEGNYIF
jgi:hypothetical protein